MKIIPVEDKVVLKMAKAEEKTQSGIILTGSAKEDTKLGEVIAVGPGGNCDGKDIVMTVKVGQKVLISGGFGSTQVKVEGEEYTIVRMSDILAVVE
ncbi:MAG: co-chaperone GroES [Oscillospiraceae bacterium]|jgi:chaperonin GroES